MSKGDLVPCYNRGCGQKFDPNVSADDCTHHPGVPVFHDAYKGWSCCKKKCTDFTEFLNIKGCTRGSHNGVKPAEPEKVDKPLVEQVVEVKPVRVSSLTRPPLDSPMIVLRPVVSPNLLEQIEGVCASRGVDSADSDVVSVGQSCHNKSCKATYRGKESDCEVCTHHPGVPIFHEGLKYWSCCQKKTTDFSVFLGQAGCTQGVHQWSAKNTDKEIKCRMDWHQTGSFVVISIFAKKYEPRESTIKLSPIRLSVDILFIEDNSRYKLDIELQGMVEVEKSSVSMLPTKVEIRLKKAEPGTWPQLTFPPRSSSHNKLDTLDIDKKEDISERVEAVDLTDL